MILQISGKIWNLLFFTIVILILFFVGMQTVSLDPYFHYHYPDTAAYFYPIDNQRSQNDGIIRNFDYQGIITGTSMTECFKTSEANELFDVDFIKVPFEGGSFKEINDNIVLAFTYNPEVSIVIRGLDTYKLFDNKDSLREDMGEYPTYLYDNNILNDVNYLFNRDVIFTRIYNMKKGKIDPGITSFDSYSNWMGKLKYGYISFGKDTLFPNGVVLGNISDNVQISEDEKCEIYENVFENVTKVAADNPETTFYYFFPPYSAAWWKTQLESGMLKREIDAEKIAIEEMLKYQNIKIFDFNMLTDITTDLNNYKDVLHYGGWINSLMLEYMAKEENIVTVDNYKELLDNKLRFYTDFDYEELSAQVDYDNDYMAEVKVAEQISSMEPVEID